jgi:hypothetical protein
MATTTEGRIVKVEFGKIKTTETIGGKKIVDSEQDYAQLTLDTTQKFPLSDKSGHELQAWGAGQKVKVTQDKGTITIEKA